MKSNFNDCLNRLLKDEGGYSNDPADSGGPTNFGITIADYRRYVKRNATADDVRRMSIDDAKSIYKARYWDALNCDALPSGVDYTVFDYGVNSGLLRPRSALRKFKDKTGADLINAINDERVDFLKSISTGKNKKFLRGWMLRVSRVRDYSLSLAKKDTVTGPTTGVAVGAGLAAILYRFWHNHEVAIVVGSLVAAAVIAAAVHFYRNKGK